MSHYDKIRAGKQESIFLQIDEDEITWCVDPINKTDIEYTKVDLLEKAEERIAKLEAALQWCLDNGGWRLLYYANRPFPDIIDASDIHNPKISQAPKGD